MKKLLALLLAAAVMLAFVIAPAEEFPGEGNEPTQQEEPAPAPETPTEAPATATPAPEKPTEAPATATPAPETPTEAPATATPAPETPTEAPATATPAPETPTEAPATATPAPGSPTPYNPATATPAPETPTEAPATATPAPGSPTPFNPVTATPAPGSPTPYNPATATPVPGSPTPYNPATATPVPGSPTPFNPATATPAPGRPTPFNPATATPVPGSPTPYNPATATPGPLDPTVTPDPLVPAETVAPEEEGPRFEDLPPVFYRVTSEDAVVSEEISIALSEAEYPTDLFSEETVLALAEIIHADPTQLMCVELFSMQLEGLTLATDVGLTLRFTNAAGSGEMPEEESGIYFGWFEKLTAVVCANGNEHVFELTFTEAGTITMILDEATLQDLLADPNNYVMILAK